MENASLIARARLQRFRYAQRRSASSVSRDTWTDIVKWFGSSTLFLPISL